MDGFQKQVSHSLRRKLSVWLSVVIVITALAAGALSFIAAFEEAIELQDEQLMQVANLVDRHQLQITQGVSPGQQPSADPEARFIVQRLNRSAIQASSTKTKVLDLPSDLLNGVQTITVGNDSWRLFVKTQGEGDRIAVGQQTAVRDEIARDSAVRTILPILILIPIMLLVVSDLIRRMFEPLAQVTSDLQARSEQDLSPVLNKNLPSEVMPFVLSINRLLTSVARSVALQRRFVADASHELRSPLTALSLQAERLESSDMSEQARQRLTVLQGGLQRSRILVDQLLTLARVQEPLKDNLVEVSVQEVFVQVIEDLMPLAEAKRIDIGVIGESKIKVTTRERDLELLLKNLVDNAIRFTPVEGRIDLSVQNYPNRVVLEINDTGPGIPEHERERVFDAFYRVAGSEENGSGLGLSIVKTIAARIGAEITLSDSQAFENRSGLCVTVSFPVAA